MRHLVLALFLSTSVYAHDHAQPELDAWYKSLRSTAGSYCCDGSDALSVLDPDWDVTPDAEWPYKVKVKYTDGTPTDWIRVHYTSVVKDNNRTGIAKVWPVLQRGGWEIRCFLPGSLS